jgi:hypothetical protein
MKQLLPILQLSKRFTSDKYMQNLPVFTCLDNYKRMI